MRYKTVAVAVLVAGAAALLIAALIRRGGEPASRPEPTLVTGGAYAELSPAQRRLVDDWVHRLGEAAGKPLNAQVLYDDLALSTRTTFMAVTHALDRTTLTSPTGASQNRTALDLVARLSTVAGSAPGKGGDKQFRLYVELVPGAFEALSGAAQFKRQADNTVYHRGYPICFRGVGGTPSIQFSLSPDHRHADIDVDYRSSTFPVMLVNGHLTASNSDVRAGDNDDRHNGHWSGLVNWWRTFLGVPLFELPREQAADIASRIASAPRVGDGAKAEDAIKDFLTAWLVEDAAGVAAGYLDERAFACLQLERGESPDRGVWRVQMARAMAHVRTILGSPASLESVLTPTSLALGGAARERRHPHRQLFSLYELREDLARDLDCAAALDPTMSSSADFGGQLATVFVLRAAGMRGQTVATMWSETDDGWKLVAYRVEPDGAAAPSIATPVAESAAPPTTQGDPEMTAAAESFLESWLLRKDTAAAMRFVAPPAYDCYNAFRSDDMPSAVGRDDAAKLIRDRMSAVADWAGKGDRLEDLLSPAEPHHLALRKVAHRSAAFTIVALPDAMRSVTDCSALEHGEAPYVDLTKAATYGRYYAVSMRLKRGGSDAAVLWTIWGRSEGAWRILSYRVLGA